MAKSSSKRPQIGDIIEITTSKGLAYALYSHEHSGQPRMGSLLRVMQGLHPTRAQSFSGLLEHKQQQFSVFFPLRAAVKQDVVQIVSHEKVPAWAAIFPIFRNGSADRYGKIHGWWLWDGEKEWKVGELTREMRFFPRLGIVNDTRLIEMIEVGYRPEDDV